ncbi:MAG: hypothetical protein WCO82_09865 [Sphingomonadales bacterium]
MALVARLQSGDFGTLVALSYAFANAAAAATLMFRIHLAGEQMKIGKSFTGHAIAAALPLSLALASCAGHIKQPASPQQLTLELNRSAAAYVSADYRVRRPTTALHFPQELGGYRAEVWQTADGAFKWTTEGQGERVERKDGLPFDRVTFTIPVDYRALPKSYAPFSPFSEGSTLVHSGQFHACLAAPCAQPAPLPITVVAESAVIGVDGGRMRGRASFISRDDGTSIFIGNLAPVDADGFVAIIDPGLPNALQQRLGRSLPQAMAYFAAIYGRLSFTPELYVSIDDTPEKNGRISSQGGTLPHQIFMHFDGAGARTRLASDKGLWLDWFFAHEAAHLFQQDKAGKLVGDDVAAWIHEGGADAMAALAMLRRGPEARAYVLDRDVEAEAACAKGLAKSPLSKATAEGNFDLHYQCGLVIWLAIDQELRRNGHDGLHDLNAALLAAVRKGKPWNQAVLLDLARQRGVSPSVIAQIAQLDTADAVAAVESLGRLAKAGLQSAT